MNRIDKSFKHLNHIPPTPVNSWSVLSQKVLNVNEKSWSYILNRPFSKSFAINSFKRSSRGKSMIVKSYFRGRRVKDLIPLNINGEQKIEKFNNKRRRSVDMVTSNIKSDLDIISPRANVLIKTQEPKHVESRKTVFSTQIDRNNRQSLNKYQIKGNNLLRRRSSLISQAPRIKKSTKQNEVDNIDTKTSIKTYELMINYLKRILSITITKSVFMKDFIELFKQYSKNNQGKLIYRSKSLDSSKKKLSVRKQAALDTCLFTEYLHNIYSHYSTIKDMDSNISGTATKNLLFRVTRNLKPEPPNTNDKTYSMNSNGIFSFKFLAMLGYLKEFIYTIKHFNKTRCLSPSIIKAERRSKHEVQTHERKTLNQFPKNNFEVDASELAKFHPNYKLSKMFKTLSKPSAKEEKDALKPKKMRSKFANSIRKSLILIKINGDKKRAKDEAKSRFKSQSICISKKTTNISSIYKLPKTLKLNNLTLHTRKGFTNEYQNNRYSDYRPQVTNKLVS